MATKTPLNLVLSISLRQESLQKLTANIGDGAPSEALSARCSLFLEKLADGGLDLSPDEVSAIQSNYGKTIHNSRDIVRATESQASLADGQSTFKFAIDPSFLPPLEQRAKEVGRPVSELISDVVDYALHENWVYGITYEGKRRTFPPETEDFFAKAIGKANFTIADLRRHVQELQSAARKAKKAELEPVGA